MFVRIVDVVDIDIRTHLAHTHSRQATHVSIAHVFLVSSYSALGIVIMNDDMMLIEDFS